jgi:CRP-like cAMP-binding protein
MTTVIHASAIADLLRKLPLLADVPEAAITALAAQCQATQVTRDGVIFLQDDPTDRVWMVQSGQVKIVYQEVDGREVILEMIAPGEVFGGAVLFFPTHPATAKAMEDCTLVSFSSEQYAGLLAQHPQVTMKLLRMLGARHRSMLNMQILAGERVERRMAHILLKLADRVGRPDPEGTLITIALARQDLADMAGTTLETAIRTLSRFSQQGLIKTQRGGFLIVRDRERLGAMADTV